MSNTINITIIITLVMIMFGSTSTTYGFLHDSNKPPQPQLKIGNPVIQEQLDILYSKYPHITQIDHDNSQHILVQDCINSTEEKSFLTSAACTLSANTILKIYLEQLGIPLQ